MKQMSIFFLKRQNLYLCSCLDESCQFINLSKNVTLGPPFISVNLIPKVSSELANFREMANSKPRV